MRTRDIDTNDTGLPIPGREHDPPRSQALEEPALAPEEQEAFLAQMRALPSRAVMERPMYPAAVHRLATVYVDATEKPIKPGQVPHFNGLAAVRDAVSDELAEAETSSSAPAPVDLVEKCCIAFWECEWPNRSHAKFADEDEGTRDGIRVGVRTILAELAAMGGEALPSVGLIERAWYSHDGPLGNQCAATANGVRNMLMRNVAPVLAAKDAERAEQARTLTQAQADIEALRAERDGLRAYIADLERVESEGPDLGCGDTSCVVAPPKGQATNGRCRCSPHKLRMVVKAMRAYREAGLAEIEKLETVAKGLRAKVAELEARIKEGAEEFADALGYVDPYFRQKWSYDDALAALRGESTQREDDPEYAAKARGT
jgi:hypothetical protein